MNRLAEADYSMTEQAMDPGARFRQNPDDRLNVKFSMMPVEDEKASAEAGRPIFTEKLFVTIIVPGERDVVIRQAWQGDFDRFPRQYAAFKNGQNQDAVSGTPLKIVPWLSQSQVKELEYFNCHTVEQLAELADTHAHRFQQINKLRTLARDFLQAAKEAAPLTAMRAELDKRDNEIETMKRQIQELSQALTEKVDKSKK
jgi:hypothetical protein